MNAKKIGRPAFFFSVWCWSLLIQAQSLQPLTDQLDLFQELSKTPGDLIMELQEDLLFKYNSSPVGSPMKMIYFQNGRQLTSDDPRNKNQSWCSLTVKIKLDENTLVPKGHKLEVVDMDTPANSEQQRVLTYNFFDFESGKKKGETSRFVPFNFQCSLPKGSKLTYQDFRQITGGRLIIYSVNDLKKRPNL